MDYESYMEGDNPYNRSFSIAEDEKAGFERMSEKEKETYVMPLLHYRGKLAVALANGNMSASLRFALKKMLSIHFDYMPPRVYDGPPGSMTECDERSAFPVNFCARNSRHYKRVFDVIEELESMGWQERALSRVREVVKDMSTVMTDKDDLTGMVREFGVFLAFAPENHRTYELCQLAVSTNFRALQFVPAEHRDREIYMSAKRALWTEIWESLRQRQRFYDFLLRKVDWTMTEEHRAEIEVNPDEYERLYGFRPEAPWAYGKISVEYFHASVEAFGLRPYGYDRESHLVEMIYPDDARDRFFALLPPSLQQEWLDESKPFLTYKSLSKIKKGLRQYNKNGKIEIDAGSLVEMIDNREEIPQELFTEEACLELVKVRPHAISQIPRKILTREMGELAVKADPSAVKHLPIAVLDEDLLYLVASLDAMCLRHVPNVLRPDGLSDFAGYVKKISNNFLPTQEDLVKVNAKMIIRDRINQRRETMRARREEQQELEEQRKLELICEDPQAIADVPYPSIEICLEAVRRQPETLYRIAHWNQIPRECDKIKVYVEAALALAEKRGDYLALLTHVRGRDRLDPKLLELARLEAGAEIWARKKLPCLKYE